VSDRGSKAIGKHLYVVSVDLELVRYGMSILVSDFKDSVKNTFSSVLPKMIASKVEDFDVLGTESSEDHKVWTLSITGKVECTNPKRSSLV